MIFAAARFRATNHFAATIAARHPNMTLTRSLAIADVRRAARPWSDFIAAIKSGLQGRIFGAHDSDHLRQKKQKQPQRFNNVQFSET